MFKRFFLHHVKNCVNLLFFQLLQNSPPLITHTAATPQDSPSTTLEEFPEFRYSISSSPGDVQMSIADEPYTLQSQTGSDTSVHNTSVNTLRLGSDNSFFVRTAYFHIY